MYLDISWDVTNLMIDSVIFCEIWIILNLNVCL